MSDFYTRSRQLLLPRSPRPIVAVEEVAEIAAQYDSDEDRLAAIERLAHPRFAYSWRQAGGPHDPKFADVTDEQYQAARAYFLEKRHA